jgi:L-2-hydroxyglutarate oxidase LhgO
MMLYEFCDRHRIAVRNTGKLLPASADDEVTRLHELLENGRNNGARGLVLLSDAEIRALDPRVRCREAMLSPSSGIVDAHGVMACLESLAAERGAVFAYGTRAERIDTLNGSLAVRVTDADGLPLDLVSERVVNAAGLYADVLAGTTGIDRDAEDYRQIPSKGEYFRVADRRRGTMDRLIYPVGVPRMRGTPAEGVHLVLELDGGMKVGPNKGFGIGDLTVDPAHRRPFWEQMHRYLPWLELEDLRPDTAGVRAMRTDGDTGERDYLMREEGERGLPGLVNLIGMESPSLTSCLAIAEHVADLLE